LYLEPIGAWPRLVYPNFDAGLIRFLSCLYLLSNKSPTPRYCDNRREGPSDAAGDIMMEYDTTHDLEDSSH
jgi:hypothetical protein